MHSNLDTRCWRRLTATERSSCNECDICVRLRLLTSSIFVPRKFLLKRASLDCNGLRPAPENLDLAPCLFGHQTISNSVATCAMKVSLLLGLLSLAAAKARSLLYEKPVTIARASLPTKRSTSIAKLTESTGQTEPCSKVGGHIDFFDLCERRRTQEQHDGTLRSLDRSFMNF